ncbi:hypothetical protein INR49_032200 [Caranx melampygus]|nr:hypothetical protein INR49_032200 [Caranx melampygus]
MHSGASLLRLSWMKVSEVFLWAFLPGRAGLTRCSTLLDLPSPAGSALLSLGLTGLKHGYPLWTADGSSLPLCTDVALSLVLKLPFALHASNTGC